MLPRPRRLTPEEEELAGLEDEVFEAVYGMSREAYNAEQQRFVQELMDEEYAEEQCYRKTKWG